MSGGTSCISWIPGLLAEEGAARGRLPVRSDDGVAFRACRPDGEFDRVPALVVCRMVNAENSGCEP